MSKLIKTSNTSKGEKLLLKSFEDKISQGTKKVIQWKREVLKLEAGVTTMQ